MMWQNSHQQVLKLIVKGYDVTDRNWVLIELGNCDNKIHNKLAEFREFTSASLENFNYISTFCAVRGKGFRGI